jgi:hypothetical protein
MNAEWKEKIRAGIKDLWHHYWSPKRLAIGVLLLSGSLTVVEVLLWRLDLPLPLSKHYFYLPAVIAALAGYWVLHNSKSKFAMITSALVAIISSTGYRYCVFVFTEISFVKILSLVMLCALCVGGIFAMLRILLNLGFE